MRLLCVFILGLSLVNLKQVPGQPYEELTDWKQNAFINREQFKTDVLRSAYSDACLKVVIKKCFKATKKVLKRVCNHFVCKKDFKSTYRTYEIRGCIQLFEGDKKPDDASAESSDGYVASCYSVRKLRTNRLNIEEREKPISKRNDTSILVGPTIEDANTNILRDRLEMACRKISTSKCIKACKFAYTHACEDSRCNKDKKRLFKKECKNQCQVSFKDAASSKSGSSSSSGSSSKGSSSSKSKSSEESGSGW